MERIILGIFRVQKVILSFQNITGHGRKVTSSTLNKADELCVLTRLQEWRDVRTVSYTKIPPRYIDNMQANVEQYSQHGITIMMLFV
jgi:hypothetical protein